MQRLGSSAGRPRSSIADSAILEAAFKLLCERGYAGTSVEAVAAEAGVGKMTIYRRYPTKPELTAAAISAHLNVEEVVFSGDTRADLARLAGETLDALFKGPTMALIGTFTVEQRNHPEFLEIFRRRISDPRRALMRSVLERGIAAGDVRPDIDIDLTIQFIAGVVLARYIHVGTPPPDGWIDTVLDALWRGISADAGSK